MEQNFNKDAVLSFIQHAQNRGVNLSNAASLGQALAYYENQYARQGNPFGPRPANGHIYDNGPWTWYSGDIISDVVSGGNAILRWLPARGVTYRNETVSHLSWVAPEGWNGQDYASYLDTIVLGDCDYGPSPKWEACQYTVQFGCMSATSHTLKLVPDFLGQRDYQRSPIYRLRGPNAGLPVSDDVDFAAATAALMFEQHLNWNIYNGVLGSPLQSDGLNEVIRVGYVDDHIVGNGACDWSDPVVVDGSTLLTPEDVLATIRGMVRFLRTRASQRNMTIAPDDMAIVMPMAMWTLLADKIPVGGLYPAHASLMTGGNTVQATEAYRSQLMTGGLGWGVMPIDGVNIPVIPGDDMDSAKNINSNTQVQGDIYILTRRAGGLVLLESQYLDYNQLSSDVPNRQFQLAQGGIFRLGWLEYNQACYQYFLEGCNRLVSYFQPLQGRINSVTLDTLVPYRIEAGGYTDAFYPQNGTPGTLGAGV